jgi:hypothetical protein
MIPVPQKDSDLAKVKAAASALGEHFDAVQIFATRHEAGELNGTVRVDFGVGNWFARFGHVVHWLQRERRANENEAEAPIED